MKVGPDEWLDVERQSRERSRAGLIGFYSTGPFVALPALISLPILMVAGEGDYIMLVMGLMWLALWIGAVRYRRTSAVGSVKRSFALWVMIWSAILSVTLLTMAVGFLIEGGWRYYPPGTMHKWSNGS
jgi:hypothetical protein